MSRPKAYSPEEGYYAQILQRNLRYDREWEHCDYATDRSDLNHLLTEYSLAYQGQGFEFKVISLPMKYWDKEKVSADVLKRRADRIARNKAALAVKAVKDEPIIHSVFSKN